MSHLNFRTKARRKFARIRNVVKRETFEVIFKHCAEVVSFTFIQALTTIFPLLDPVKRPMRASGIFSNPSITVSSVWILPCITHVAICLMPSSHRSNQRVTKKPSIFNCWIYGDQHERRDKKDQQTYKKTYIEHEGVGGHRDPRPFLIIVCSNSSTNRNATERIHMVDNSGCIISTNVVKKTIHALGCTIFQRIFGLCL